MVIATSGISQVSSTRAVKSLIRTARPIGYWVMGIRVNCGADRADASPYGVQSEPARPQLQ